MPPTPRRYAVQRVAGLDGLARLRDPWHSLHKGASLAARYEWHLAVARHLPQGSSPPSYVQVLDGTRTVAIFPMIAAAVPVRMLGRMRVMGLGMSEAMQLEDFPLAADARIEEIAIAFRAALARWPQPCAAVFWPRVLEDSNAMRLARALEPVTHLQPARPCDVLDTRRAFTEALAGWSKNVRHSVRKSHRRLAEQGGALATVNGAACWREHCLPMPPTNADAESIRAAFETFLEIEASGWKGKEGEGTAIALDRSTRAFLDELIALRSDGFAPEVFLLVHGERAIAGQFTVRVNDTRYALKIGYDESEARFSPGQSLMAIVVEDACSRGLAGVNLITSAAWHATWRPVRAPTWRVMIFRRKWQAAAYKASRFAFRTAKTMLRT